MGDRVLVVAAHPDDELLGVGGTILRHVAAGDDVFIDILCNGSLRDYPSRVTAAYAAANDNGYFVRFMGEYDQLGYVVPEVDATGYDIVYTHHPGDLNRDHRLVAEAVQVACRPYTSDVRSLRYFETPSSTEWGTGFSPNLFVGIDAYLGEKLSLLSLYESEMRDPPHPRSADALIHRARYWGSVSGSPAAEAFVIGRERW